MGYGTAVLRKVYLTQNPTRDERAGVINNSTQLGAARFEDGRRMGHLVVSCGPAEAVMTNCEARRSTTATR